MRGQPLAAEAVVEAVAQAIEPRGAGPLDLGRKRGQGRVRIVGRQQLAEPREPAGFFEVQVGDQQRAAIGPEQGAADRRDERFTCERKGNHRPALIGKAAAYSKLRI